jgi:hypothetical protein
MHSTEPSDGAGKGRRKLLAGIGILSLLSFLKIGSLGAKRKVVSCAPPEEKKTIKLLSQDGTLVEVDVSKIKRLDRKVSNKELQEWIKRS